MKLPDFVEEKRLFKQGYKTVAGLDEAGRGPLAGPVVAAAVVLLNSKHEIRMSSLKVRDSKQLSEKQREKIYKVLTNHPDIKWGVGIVSEKIIDKINILQASKLAMAKAVEDLGVEPDFLLVDGNFKIYCLPAGRQVRQKSIIAGDQKVFSIAAASIIAKVTRDRLMQKYHKKYPQYNFLQNKGYPTKAHFTALEKFGACKIHRKSFYPVSSYN